ncbi:MAG: heparan-alpha-glucosaminide N-acetyltransferase domain-containing protein [Pirellulales bacterium]|nr:heparan-alpha-glucosaminide N-acetyltransferase domain-containing protein [Pirellulales bacterium]
MRLLSIDILRTAAIGMMVLVHFVENLSAQYSPSVAGPASREHLWWLPVGLAAPLFTLLAGVSYYSWLTLQRDRGIDDRTISKRTVRRGLFLIGIGFAFNVFVWLPEDTFNWDILTFIGSALIFLNIIRKIPTEVLVFGIILVAIISPALQGISDYYAFWVNGYFEYDFILSDIVLGYLATGYFPIFPWIIFPAIGFVIAPILFPSAATHSRGQRPSKLLLTTCLSIGCIAASVVLQQITFLSPLIYRKTMFPASTSYLLGAIGLSTLSLFALHRIVDKKEDETTHSHAFEDLAKWFRVVSKHSLSIYLIHHMIHLWPLWIYGLMTVGEPTAHWQKTLPVIFSTTLALFFCALVIPAFLIIDKYRVPTAERIMRWIGD